MSITPEVLGGLGGIVLSMLFTYIPGLRTNWANLPKEKQQLYMMGMLLGITGLVIASSCFNLWVFISCTKEGIMGIFGVFGSAVLGNVTAYNALPQPPDVRTVRQMRKAKETTTASEVVDVPAADIKG